MLRRNVVKKKLSSKIEAIVENDILFGGMKEEEVGIAAYKTCTDTEVLISLSPIRHGWQDLCIVWGRSASQRPSRQGRLLPGS